MVSNSKSYSKIPHGNPKKIINFAKTKHTIMPKRVRIISKETEQEQIIRKCDCCYVAMVDENNNPYVLPFNFGYSDKCIYLHSGREGRKLDILKKNNKVCIAFSTGHKLNAQHENVACSYSMFYKSVLCHGKVEFIEDYDMKTEAMNIIMRQYTGRDFNYSAPSINNVIIYKIPVKEMTGKEFANLS